jgi:hypothetical protein
LGQRLIERLWPQDELAKKDVVAGLHLLYDGFGRAALLQVLL